MKPQIFTPTVTIMKENGQLDIDGNLKLMDALIAGGVDGFVPMGSTGEYPFFKNNEEKKAYLNEYIEAAKGRTQLLVGTGGIGYKETVELSNYVLERGVKGVLVISEFYFNMSQKDFYDYYAFMAEHIERDLYIYNFPARTGSSIEADTIVELVKRYDNIKGLKDSVMDFAHTGEILRKVLPVRPDFEAFSGYDHHFLDNIALGGAGGISALSNMVPKVWSAWVRAARQGDKAGMELGLKKITDLMAFYSLESNPQKLIKEVLCREGIEVNTWCHFPYDYLTEGSLEKAMEMIGEDYK